MRSPDWWSAVAGAAMLAAVLADASIAHAAPVPSIELLAQVQPLRPRLARPEDAPVSLRPAALAHSRAQWAAACVAAAHLRQTRLQGAARLFYGPQRAQADLAGLDAFLAANVRGPAPLFEIAAESLVPAAHFRALGVDSCVRAGRPDLALPFVASVGGMGQDALARVALAVVRVQAAGAWSASAAELMGERGGVHVTVLRALAAGRRRGLALLVEAERTALAPAEAALVAAARKALDREEPAP